MPTRKKPSIVDAHFAFATCLTRAVSAESARKQITSEANFEEQTTEKAVSDIMFVTPGKVTIASEMALVSLALLEVAIEAWEKRFGFTDPAVDRMLKDKSLRPELRNIRNRVFHPVASAEWEEVLNNTDTLIPWAEAVRNAMSEYSIRWFARAFREKKLVLSNGQLIYRVDRPPG